ncbi:PilZ domain-containing protein [Alteromonas sp. 1_MG-2023]|uniref:PilZ domain-containing protein n=1 Tax=Alteromonas sp. 1_MG-2023 TaxID=3062669 RepID=UPI0026E26CB8|nr:PilZ domain-containing protein [Alteromonas sp. 1_MG-2023]MDO6476027.1 PilZ domain-containing protein [Alteromonas sp. 1_MG-2023]
MSNETLADKQAQFDEFFMITSELPVNVVPLEAGKPVPASDDLESVMPYAFRIAGEMAAIEAQALRPLRNLGDHAAALTDYLNHQARKIDLMMSYILHQQDDETCRYQTVKFGGGGIIVSTASPYETGTLAELKLFLNQEAAAVYCFGEVIACQQHGDDYHISFIFRSIREQDQELLVRASLHLQTQQLRKRAQDKQE